MRIKRIPRALMALPRHATSPSRAMSLLVSPPVQATQAQSSGSRDRIWNPTKGIRFHSAATQSTLPTSNVAAFKQNGRPSRQDVLQQDQSRGEHGDQGTDDRGYAISRSGNPVDHSSCDRGNATTTGKAGSIGSQLRSSTFEEISGEGDADSQTFSASDSSDDLWEEASEASQSSAETRAPKESAATILPETLSHSIPLQVMEQALLSQSGDPSKIVHWTHELYKDAKGAPPTTYYCRKLAHSERVARYFLEEPVLGFDIEWAFEPGIKRTIKNNVSLLQLASPSKIGIFHFALHDGDTIDDILAPTLKQIMESPDIIKTGVAIKGDCTRLRTNLDIHSRGVFELSRLHRLVRYASSAPELVNRRLVALKDQVQEHLQLPLAKGAVRTSAWNRSLDMEQTKYAAADAYAGLMLYDVLERKRLSMVPYQPRPAFIDEDVPIMVVRDRVGVANMQSAEETSEDPTAELVNDMADLKVAEERVETTLGFSDDLGPPNEERPRSYRIPSKARPTAAAMVNAPTTLPHRELQQAEDWVDSYHAPYHRIADTSDEVTAMTQTASRVPLPTKARTSRARLRAYTLWHHQALSCAEVAAMVKQPPLQTSTVALYILQAIHSEGLPFDDGRLQDVASDVEFVPSVLRFSKVVGPYVKRDK